MGFELLQELTESKEAREEREQEAANALKTDEEKLADAFRSCEEAGKKLPRRLMGQVDRETGKLTDQFTILEGHEDEVDKIVMDTFLDELDNELEGRGLIFFEED